MDIANEYAEYVVENVQHNAWFHDHLKKLLAEAFCAGYKHKDDAFVAFLKTYNPSAISHLPDAGVKAAIDARLMTMCTMNEIVSDTVKTLESEVEEVIQEIERVKKALP